MFRADMPDLLSELNIDIFEPSPAGPEKHYKKYASSLI